MSRLSLIASLLCLACLAPHAQASDGDAGAAIAAATGFSAVRLSPDGEYVAAIVRTPNQPQARNLVTMRLADSRISVLTGYADIDVSWFAWASDTHLLFGTESRSDRPGQPARYRGAFSINREGDGGTMIERARAKRMSFLARVPGDRNGVLITRPGKHPGGVDVFRLDLKRGATKKIVDSGHEISYWVPDNLGRVRAAVGRSAGDRDGRERLLYQPVDSDEWRELLEFDASEFRLLAFQADNRRLIAASRIGREHFALLEFDPDNLRSGRVLVEEAGYDVYGAGNGALTQSRTGHLVSYRYVSDRPRIVYFDRRWEGRQTAIDEVLPDSVNSIVDFGDDERKLLVLSSGGRGGDYYIFDDIVRQLKFLVASAD